MELLGLVSELAVNPVPVYLIVLSTVVYYSNMGGDCRYARFSIEIGISQAYTVSDG